MRDAVAEARDLIRVVADDLGLPRFARREANGLLLMAASEPELVPARLDALRTRVLPDLPLWPPECDYARCVSVATFWRFHLAPAVRGGVPDERIDEDIPLAALGGLQWRP